MPSSEVYEPQRVGHWRSAPVHPENLPDAKKEDAFKQLPVLLFLCALSGIIGMAWGTVALSSALDDWKSLISIVPLVTALVVLVTGWVAAMFCLMKEEP